MNRLGTSLGPSLGVPALLLHCGSWFALLAHGHLWLGAWTKAVEEVAGSVIIVGPLLAGLTANLYARRGETALPMLVVGSAHPHRGWYLPAARLWLVALANLVLVIGEVAVLVTLVGPPLALRPLLVMPHCALVLAVHVLVGMVIGLRLSPRLAGAVAGTCSFGLFLLAVAHLAPEAFVTGGVTEDLVGMQYRVPSVLVLGLIALATLAALAVATSWTSRWVRARLVVALVFTSVAMVLSNDDLVQDDRRFEVAQVALRCRGSSPAVCMPVDAPRSLAAATRGMHRLAGPLRRAGAALPERWVDYWGQPPDQRVGMLSLRSGAELGTGVADADLVRSLTMPATCAGILDNRDTQRSLDVRLLLEHWIAFRNGLGHGYPPDRREWFSSLDSEAWVQSTYAKLRSCDLEALRFPSRNR